MAAASERLKMFEKVLAGINADPKYKDDTGDNIIAKLSDKPLNVETISSGSLVLDQILGGGLGKGRIIEIYGPESSGKTSIALTAVGNVQKEGGIAVFIDAENALDPRYAAKLGVNIKELAVSQPGTAEQAIDLIQDLTNSKMVDIIVLDSVAALVPKRELEGDSADMTIGELARLLSKELRKLSRPAARNGVTIIFLNQTRDKIGGFSPFGTPQTTPGGKALKFYASQRVRVSKGKPVMSDSGDDKGKNIGNIIKFKIEKNKIAPPFGVGESVLTYNHGINVPAEIMEVGVSYGIIDKPNNRTYIEHETNEVMGTSKAAALEEIRSNSELRARLEAAMKLAIAKDIYGEHVPEDEIESPAVADTTLNIDEGEELANATVKEKVARKAAPKKASPKQKDVEED